MRHIVFAVLVALAFLAVPTRNASAAGQANPCARADAGSVVPRPPDLYSHQGVLKLSLDYLTGTDAAGRALFCFKTPTGLESPTLHVHPGETLDITVTNRVPAPPNGSPSETVATAADACGDLVMTLTSVNVHFHGTNAPPTCHSDEVIRTLINSGHTFHYLVSLPKDEPPGLYWYHPHVHGMSETAVLGGASGAIVVEGIENLQPAVAGLPERILIIRDQNVGASAVAAVPVPAWDVALNYVPISYPKYKPAFLEVSDHGQEFWRVLNASADTIIDLQLRYDGQAQPLQVVALDGVPTGSQDGTRRGKIVTVSHILLPPAGRAEMIIAAPPRGVKLAQLVTRNIDTGPDGDFDPERPLAVLKTSTALNSTPAIAAPSQPGWVQRFEGLETAPVTANRKLYFSEVLSDPNNSASPTNFFITVDGATPTLFDPVNPPAITTTQGSVEDWIIENRSGENHEFHIHQIHFLVTKRNGVAVAADRRQMRDTIQVPYWTGTGPYPSVTIRMDFRGPDIGDFVYHCHILGHEDNGMMAIIRVQKEGA